MTTRYLFNAQVIKLKYHQHENVVGNNLYENSIFGQISGFISIHENGNCRQKIKFVKLQKKITIKYPLKSQVLTKIGFMKEEP